MAATNIALSLRAKGAGGLAERAVTILSRFGPTEKRMEQCLTQYVDLVGEFNARPSLPITACVLARHPAMIRRFFDRGVEFGLHGLVHNDHATLTLDEQRESICRAADIFRAVGVPTYGFRGPYLRYNQFTDQVVRELGLLYHSSQAVVFATLPGGVNRNARLGTYRRALKLYEAQDAARVVVRPRDELGLVTIPVAIPDDEIMVDRLHLGDNDQAAVWLSILEKTYARGDLFTVQLHPERIRYSAYAVRAVLEEARLQCPEVWIATLDEIAVWWRARSQSTLKVHRIEGERYRVCLEGTPEASLLVRGLPAVNAVHWYGRDALASSRDFEVRSAVKPVVGVSTRSPKAVLDFLFEEGFPSEVSDDRNQFGAYLDVAGEDFTEVGILGEIEQTQGPLVRLSRWPNGVRSALAVTGDIDSITIQDFGLRLWETRRRSSSARQRSVVSGEGSSFV